MPDEFKLEVPIDASEITGRRAQEPVKVVVVDAAGKTRSTVVTLDDKGHGTARFSFPGKPGNLRVLLGPEGATDQSLQELQTVGVAVSARRFTEPVLKLRPVIVPPIFWEHWRRWCRTFVVRGRVVCADGSPVPGATVTAFDIDKFWWFTSKDTVATATTDATGAFSMRFTWCCGFLPIVWWRRRTWQLDPYLLDKISELVHRDPRLPPLPPVGPTPDLGLFDRLLAPRLDLAARSARSTAASREVSPSALTELQDRLIKVLPPAAELTALGVWPWVRWTPWFDCNPDLVFRVTQNCDGQDRVIVDESVAATRWNVPPALDVTLVADERACCVPHDSTRPDGDCLVLSTVCGVNVNHIGGNPGAPATPAGYASPGADDRPFAGGVSISGKFGSGADADFYEFQVSSDGGTTWSTLPTSATGGFARQYWGPPVGTALPAQWNTVGFSPKPISGHNVFESREHYEQTHDPSSWGVSRLWSAGNFDLLMVWLTDSLLFADGTYQLRVQSWSEGPGGQLVTPPRILPLCDTDDGNGVTIRLDNRIVGAGSGHPGGHPCGPGTIHTCTLEPDTEIVTVRFDGVTVPPCTIKSISPDSVLTVDFIARDPDGHLGGYSLLSTWGANLARDLLAQPSAVITPLTGSEIGPSYALARAQGATSPTWTGGTYRLTMRAIEAFPESCAYQLELRASKRTIVSCSGSLHENLSQTSFTVQV